jgi:hypothetical protein
MCQLFLAKVQTALFASSTGSSTIDEDRKTALELSAVRLTSPVRKKQKSFLKTSLTRIGPLMMTSAEGYCPDTWTGFTLVYLLASPG